jgi:16S rRNA (adenine1518-N6/adenine1519-N6)-dimethyltransferase
MTNNCRMPAFFRRFFAMLMLHPKQILSHYGIEAKKSLGQNFISDDNVLARVAAAADLRRADNVLEVGPGLGSLTHHLARAAGRVVAVELDARLLPILRVELGHYDNVELVQGDILEQDPSQWFGAEPYKVVANVPYYITGAILRHLLSGKSKPGLMVLTVQKEVADRMTAVPGNMSLLSVSVQFYGRATIVDRLKAGAFWPRPGVDSAIVRLELWPEPVAPQADEKAFFHIVKMGFSQKRKQLKNNLRGLGMSATEVERAMEEASIDGRRRAETLSLEEWTVLHQVVDSKRQPPSH